VRGQTHLPALAVALLVVTTTAGLGFAIADRAFAEADRDADQRRVAVALSERLVSPGDTVTVRANVLNRSALTGMTREQFRQRYPVIGNRSVRIRLDERTVLRDGTPADGTTIRRVILVHTVERRTYEPRFRVSNATTLPRRTDRVKIAIEPSAATAVRTVRVNERVGLHNATGLRGNFSIDVSRFETTTLEFAANRSMARGDVRVWYFPSETTKATLAVTVDD